MNDRDDEAEDAARTGGQPSERNDARAEAVQRYVDELLERSWGEEDDTDALERGLAAWRAERDGRGAGRERVETVPSTNRLRRLVAPLASAAGLILAVTVVLVFVLGPAAPTAEAALADAIERARELVPRAYRVVHERGAPRNRRVEVDLFTSGDRAFAMSRTVTLLEGRPRTLWMGGDDEGFWVVPPNPRRPVLVVEQRADASDVLEENEVDLPFVDVVSALEACSDLYDASISDDGRVLEGTRRDDAPKGRPTGFRLELDEDGLLAHLSMWRDDHERRPDWRYELTASSGPVDPAVFVRSSHHEPDREVLRR